MKHNLTGPLNLGNDDWHPAARARQPVDINDEIALARAEAALQTSALQPLRTTA